MNTILRKSLIYSFIAIFLAVVIAVSIHYLGPKKMAQEATEEVLKAETGISVTVTQTPAQPLEKQQ